MRKNVLIIVLAALIVGAGAAYTFAKPKPHTRPKHINGTIYVLPKEFLLNLSDGRYAKMNIALVLDHDQATAASGGHEGGGTPPDGFGTLEQEAAVRDIITNVVTDTKGDDLIRVDGRERIKRAILTQINRDTDVRTEDVLITDVAVQ